MEERASSPSGLPLALMTVSATVVADAGTFRVTLTEAPASGVTGEAEAAEPEFKRLMFAPIA